MNAITKCGFVALMIAVPVVGKASTSAGKYCERTWNGTVGLVNPQNNTVTVNHLGLTRQFTLGQHCGIVMLDKKQAALSDLSPGERVMVRYCEAEGVRVADQITERALRYNGTIHAVDQKTGTLTMEEVPLYRPFHAPERFRIASDCQVSRWDGHEGTPAELQTGDRISIIYELPGGSPVAYRIRDMSSSFVGAIEAVNLTDRTVKAKALHDEKTFDLGSSCQIVLPGEKAGKLKDLALGQKCKFTYENVDGVNVLDRIAPAQEGKTTETASTQ